MRLLYSDKKRIKQSFVDVFSDKSHIYFFRSRADDTKKGAEDESIEVDFDKKIKFLTLLPSSLREKLVYR